MPPGPQKSSPNLKIMFVNLSCMFYHYIIALFRVLAIAKFAVSKSVLEIFTKKVRGGETPSTIVVFE